jgi:hypothetical protein
MFESQNGVLYSTPFASEAYVVTAGVVAFAGLPSALKNGAALSDRCFGLRPVSGGKAARGVRIWPYLTAAANDDVAYRLYAMMPFAAGDGRTPSMYALELLGSGVFTAGAGTGVDGAIVDDASLWCDTITWTKAAAGTAVFDALQAADAQAYSPANDTPGFLQVPDVGGAAFLVLDILGAADEFFGAVIEAIT